MEIKPVGADNTKLSARRKNCDELKLSRKKSQSTKIIRRQPEQIRAFIITIINL